MFGLPADNLRRKYYTKKSPAPHPFWNDSEFKFKRVSRIKVWPLGVVTRWEWSVGVVIKWVWALGVVIRCGHGVHYPLKIRLNYLWC